ncbi:MAG: hypothetical protein ACO29U_10230, partial [Crocinitomicaceae bacterium]
PDFNKNPIEQITADSYLKKQLAEISPHKAITGLPASLSDFSNSKIDEISFFKIDLTSSISCLAPNSFARDVTDFSSF